MVGYLLLCRSATLLRASGFMRLGTKTPQFGFWGGESREAAIQADRYPREYQNAWFVEILQAGEMKVYLSRKFGNITRATQQTGHDAPFGLCPLIANQPDRKRIVDTSDGANMNVFVTSGRDCGHFLP